MDLQNNLSHPSSTPPPRGGNDPAGVHSITRGRVQYINPAKIPQIALRPRNDGNTIIINLRDTYKTSSVPVISNTLLSLTLLKMKISYQNFLMTARNYVYGLVQLQQPYTQNVCPTNTVLIATNFAASLKEKKYYIALFSYIPTD